MLEAKQEKEKKEAFFVYVINCFSFILITQNNRFLFNKTPQKTKKFGNPLNRHQKEEQNNEDKYTKRR